MSRVLFIEDPGNIDYPLRFEMVGHTGQGKLKIQLQERTTGTFWVRYISMPKRLSADAQIIPAPDNIAEWIVVETCRRLASSSSNVPLISFFSGESSQLQMDAIRSMGQKRRMKRLRMRTQRSRPNMGYRAGWYNQTGQDNGQ